MKDYRKKYWDRPGAKEKRQARRKAKRQTEEWKSGRKVRRHKPEYTAKQSAKRQTPEFKAKHRKYMNARNRKKRLERERFRENHSIPKIEARLKTFFRNKKHKNAN
jgi:hypothetical protein